MPTATGYWLQKGKVVVTGSRSSALRTLVCCQGLRAALAPFRLSAQRAPLRPKKQWRKPSVPSVNLSVECLCPPPVGGFNGPAKKATLVGTLSTWRRLQSSVFNSVAATPCQFYYSRRTISGGHLHDSAWCLRQHLEEK